MKKMLISLFFIGASINIAGGPAPEKSSGTLLKEAAVQLVGELRTTINNKSEGPIWAAWIPDSWWGKSWSWLKSAGFRKIEFVKINAKESYRMYHTKNLLRIVAFVCKDGELKEVMKEIIPGSKDVEIYVNPSNATITIKKI
jgi:hypothetical protein